MSYTTEFSKKYGSFYDNISRENSRRWSELKSDRGDAWREAKKAYNKASEKLREKETSEKDRGWGYKTKGYNALKKAVEIKLLTGKHKKLHYGGNPPSLSADAGGKNREVKDFAPEKLLSNKADSSGNILALFNGIGLNLNLGYLGIGIQRIFDRGRDVDYIFFQYNHKPGVNICGSLFKVLDFDEENYKGWFVDGGAFFRGLGIDFFTSPEVEEPVCRGWGINLAYPFDSGFSVVPQYYDTPSGWMGKVFGMNAKQHS